MSDIPSGHKLLEGIREGKYWGECWNCCVRIESHMEAWNDDLEGQDCRVLDPCCTLDGGLFCCKECRGQYKEHLIHTRSQGLEQARIVRRVFGGDAEIISARGGCRSGFCRCRDLFGHGVEYPGVIDFKLPGLQYGNVTGCAICRTWGVPNGDIKSGAWKAICDKYGIITE